MTISFNTIPSNIRVPLTYVEFSNERAVSGLVSAERQALLIGQKLSAGTAALDELVLVTSADHAKALFGVGSMLAMMFATFKKADPFVKTWAIPLTEADGTPAAGSIKFGGAVSAAGVVYFYIGGKRVSFSVTSAEALADIATAMAAAITADTELPVTAAVDGEDATKVNITCRWDGETGNDIDLRVNYYRGETLPAGLTATIVDMASGATNPDVADAIAVMGDEYYQTIVCPFTDDANLDLLEAELLDRWGGVRQIEGQAYIAYRGSNGDSVTYGDTRNSALASCIGTNLSPTPSYVWAASYAGVADRYLANDPARQLNTLILPDVLPPAESDRWTIAENNLLLYAGISTHYVDAGGVVRIQRAITMYQENPLGLEDPSYLDVTTPATVGYLRYSWRARMSQKFPRHKLADDDNDFGPGQAIVTPKTGRAESFALAKQWVERGLVENVDQFKTDQICERNADNHNRLDFLLPPNLVNQLHIMAAQIQFIL